MNGLKATFEIKTRHYCGGCAEPFFVVEIMDPKYVRFDEKTLIGERIWRHLEQISMTACPKCAGKTERRDIYFGRDEE